MMARWREVVIAFRHVGQVHGLGIIERSRRVFQPLTERGGEGLPIWPKL
jgi:hypothetical protein